MPIHPQCWGYTATVPDSMPPQTTLEPGLVLDRYELLCPLARGGMANVWIGRFHGKQKAIA